MNWLIRKLENWNRRIEARNERKIMENERQKRALVQQWRRTRDGA